MKEPSTPDGDVVHVLVDETNRKIVLQPAKWRFVTKYDFQRRRIAYLNFMDNYCVSTTLKDETFESQLELLASGSFLRDYSSSSLFVTDDFPKFDDPLCDRLPQFEAQTELMARKRRSVEDPNSWYYRRQARRFSGQAQSQLLRMNNCKNGGSCDNRDEAIGSVSDDGLDSIVRTSGNSMGQAQTQMFPWQSSHGQAGSGQGAYGNYGRSAGNAGTLGTTDLEMNPATGAVTRQGMGIPSIKPMGTATKTPMGTVIKTPMGQATKTPMGPATKTPMSKAPTKPILDRWQRDIVESIVDTGEEVMASIALMATQEPSRGIPMEEWMDIDMERQALWVAWGKEMENRPWDQVPRMTPIGPRPPVKRIMGFKTPWHRPQVMGVRVLEVHSPRFKAPSAAQDHFPGSPNHLEAGDSRLQPTSKEGIRVPQVRQELHYRVA
eukprot:snap_masked-scaffold106_size358372-processed-gene-1.12 protein:Tk03538 transcript:snap_masked-scaffold106_size358372-processed-gene-1.12-mRNA-1 annotation:"predicted protein"